MTLPPHHEILPFRWRVAAWVQVLMVLALLVSSVSPQWHGVLFHGDAITESHPAEDHDHSENREHAPDGHCLLCFSAQGGGVFEKQGGFEWNAPDVSALPVHWTVAFDVIQGAVLYGAVSIRGPPVVKKG